MVLEPFVYAALGSIFSIFLAKSSCQYVKNTLSLFALQVLPVSYDFQQPPNTITDPEEKKTFLIAQRNEFYKTKLPIIRKIEKIVECNSVIFASSLTIAITALTYASRNPMFSPQHAMLLTACFLIFVYSTYVLMNKFMDKDFWAKIMPFGVKRYDAIISIGSACVALYILLVVMMEVNRIIFFVLLFWIVLAMVRIGRILQMRHGEEIIIERQGRYPNVNEYVKDSKIEAALMVLMIIMSATIFYVTNLSILEGAQSNTIGFWEVSIALAPCIVPIIVLLYRYLLVININNFYIVVFGVRKKKFPPEI